MHVAGCMRKSCHICRRLHVSAAGHKESAEGRGRAEASTANAEWDVKAPADPARPFGVRQSLVQDHRDRTWHGRRIREPLSIVSARDAGWFHRG